MTPSLLIVGAEPDAALVERLRARGVEVRHRAAAGPDDVRAAAPTALLLDWELASGSGSGLCTRLKRDPELRTLWVVLAGTDAEALTAHRDQSRYPADAYLRRPFGPRDLERALDAQPAGDAVAGDEVAGEATRPEPPAPEAPPSEAPPPTADAASLRRRLAELTAPPEAGSPPRGGPEEKQQWLRAHIRALEDRHRELGALASEIAAHADAQAQSAARADGARIQAESDVVVARAETERVKRRFEAYEAEVHRVVHTKQAAEQRSAEALRAARDRITELETQLRTTAADRADQAGRLDAASKRTAEAERLVDALRRELTARDDHISALGARLAESDALLDEMQSEVVRLRAAAGRAEDAERRLSALESRFQTWMSTRRELEAILGAGLDN